VPGKKEEVGNGEKEDPPRNKREGRGLRQCGENIHKTPLILGRAYIIRGGGAAGRDWARRPGD